MSENCPCCGSGLFRVHVFGDVTRSHISATDICRALDSIAGSWNISPNSKFLDVFFRNKPMPSDGPAITWPEQKSTYAWLWMGADVTNKEKKERAFHELINRFCPNDFNLHSHNSIKDPQSCFTTDNRLFVVHLLGDMAISKLTHSDLRSAINEEANRLIELLPGSMVDIVIEHTSRPINLGGRTATGKVHVIKNGMHYNPTFVRITINLFDSNPLAEVIRDIRITLRHELHHFRFFESGQRVDRLLDELIYEGLAVAFEVELDPDHLPVYAYAVERKDLKKLWQLATPLLHESGHYYDWMHGRGNLPRWAGYTLGYEMVKYYLHHNPGYGAAELIHVPSDEYVPYVKF